MGCQNNIIEHAVDLLHHGHEVLRVDETSVQLVTLELEPNFFCSLLDVIQVGRGYRSFELQCLPDKVIYLQNKSVDFGLPRGALLLNG